MEITLVKRQDIDWEIYEYKSKPQLVRNICNMYKWPTKNCFKDTQRMSLKMGKRQAGNQIGKEHFQITNKHMKRCSSWKCQLKPQLKTKGYTIKWLKCKRVPVPKVVKEMEQLELSDPTARSRNVYDQGRKLFGSVHES